MKVYAQIKKGKYIDSLETLFSSSVLNEQPDVDVGYVGMATASFKDILAEIGLMTEEIDGCGDNDYVIVARAESEEAFRQAAAAVTEDAAAQQGGAEQSNGESFLQCAHGCTGPSGGQHVFHSGTGRICAFRGEKGSERGAALCGVFQ